MHTCEITEYVAQNACQSQDDVDRGQPPSTAAGPCVRTAADQAICSAMYSAGNLAPEAHHTMTEHTAVNIVARMVSALEQHSRAAVKAAEPSSNQRIRVCGAHLTQPEPECNKHTSLLVNSSEAQAATQHLERVSADHTSANECASNSSRIRCTGPISGTTACTSTSPATTCVTSSGTSISGSVRTVGSSRLSSLVSMNSTAQHYFVNKLDPSTSSHTCYPEEGDMKQDESDMEVPPRVHSRAHEYASGAVLVLLVAMMVWVFYNSTTKIIQLQAYYAFAIIPILPLGVIFFAFAVSTMIRGLLYIGLGGMSPLDANSQNYSAIKTPVKTGTRLPHIIVQMPVYKESLDEVIKPSFISVRRAMEAYEDKGGQVKCVVCDDGFQVIPLDDAIARANFYTQQGISYIARPPVNRRGVFKKASNLNYQLGVSEQVSRIMRDNTAVACDDALLTVWEEYDKEFVAGGDLSMNEDCLILLIDADTRVPEGCMFDVVGEFLEGPEVAYTQHCTEPFTEQNRNYWEQHISHFTRIVYSQAIAVAVAYGDSAPLVGHNAFLRWSALKKVGYSDSSCRPGQTKYWSESSVSEDFDMYIRLASIGSFGRYVMYTGPDFQEGVSLTYMDEVIKLKKFAYGACEILFQPFKYWLPRGPFNHNLLRYLAAKNIAWYQKVSMMSYLSSYLAMGAAFYYCLFEGIMSIVDPMFHDHFLPRSFDVMLMSNIIFAGMGTLCGEVLFQWRRQGHGNKTNIFIIAWNQIKWLPTTILFFYSALFPVTEACFVYLFSLKVTWGATAKTTHKTRCWSALRDTLLGLKYEYVLYVSLMTGYLVVAVIFKVGLYRAWAVPSYCIAHIAGPIVLNPVIMSFYW